MDKHFKFPSCNHRYDPNDGVCDPRDGDTDDGQCGKCGSHYKADVLPLEFSADDVGLIGYWCMKCKQGFCHRCCFKR